MSSFNSIITIYYPSIVSPHEGYCCN